MDTPAPRKAVVDGYAADGTPALLYYDSRMGMGVRPSPPFVGSVVDGAFSGLYSAPRLPQQAVTPQNPGAQVMVLSEVGYRPVAAVSTTDRPDLLPRRAPGATGIWRPDGSFLEFAPTGPVTLYSNAAGTLVVSVDPATNRVNVAASGGLWVNGVQVTVP